MEPGEPMRPYETKKRPNRRLRHFQHLVGLIEHVPGDVVECGVGAGKTLYMLAALTERRGTTPGGSGAFDRPIRRTRSSSSPKRRLDAFGVTVRSSAGSETESGRRRDRMRCRATIGAVSGIDRKTAA